jgi:glycosyltransferase involved in cell wall biosynthesis
MRLLTVIEAGSVTGPAKNLLEFARLAGPMGVDVAIVAITRGPAHNSFLDAARAAEIQTEVVREQHIFDRAVIAGLRDVVTRNKPDIIQTHAVKSHFLARWAGLPNIFPWIAFHHGYTQTAARVRFYNQLDRWSLRAARKVITVSVPFRDELVRRGVPPENIEIVHNAIAADWGCAARRESAALRQNLDIPLDWPVILNVGRLSKEKDHLTLLKAVRSLRVQLVLVGEGPGRGDLEATISRFGLTGRVTLTGHQESVAPYYGMAQVVAISSLSEGSPNVLLEAMASGVPVVATNVGGIPEHVEDGRSALLVQPRDVSAMGAAIAELIGPDLRLAQGLAARGRELVRERYAPEARVRKLIGIYQSALFENATAGR